MAVRKFKPTSPGRRFMTVSDFQEITKSEPEKTLLAPLSKRAGRNVHGRITTRHRGGGHKRRYRIVDFKRRKDGVTARVHSIEYDPNRSARIALLHYADGEKRYILAPLRLRVGQTVESGGKAGRSRWKGKRPTVRGTVMNPVDHPHGGGEGKNKGSHPVTPWGKPTLGFRTRNKKKASTNDIVRSRKRGKGNR